MHVKNRATEQQNSRTAEQQNSRTAEQQSSRATEQQSNRATEQQSSSYCATVLQRYLEFFLKIPKEFTNLFNKRFYSSYIFFYITKFFGELEEIFCFSQRPTSYIYKTRQLAFTPASVTFNNICGNRKGSPSNLTGNSKFLIYGELFRKLIDTNSKLMCLLPDNKIFIFRHENIISCYCSTVPQGDFNNEETCD